MNNNVFSIRSWMESNAIEQFNQILSKDTILQGAGMPDMHLGKYGPNGSVFSSSCVHPVLAGNDIGCGYSFSQLSKSFKIDKLTKKISQLEEVDIMDILSSSFMDQYHVEFIESLGTVGGGNHFLEVQVVHEIVNQKEFDQYHLDKSAQYVLIHSGSRGLGTQILNDYISEHNDNPLTGQDAEDYMKKHNIAMQYAVHNRQMLLERFSLSSNSDIQNIFDVPHNFIEKYEDIFIHRKGSSTATQGLVMVPGSRGDFSYLVKPLPKKDALYTIAHGAGRKISRSDARYKISPMKNKMDKNFFKNDISNTIICDDKHLNQEEDAMCYKNISHVIQDMLDHQLIEVIAIMKPVITYKKYDADKIIKTEKQRDIERKQARKQKYNR